MSDTVVALAVLVGCLLALVVAVRLDMWLSRRDDEKLQRELDELRALYQQRKDSE